MYKNYASYILLIKFTVDSILRSIDTVHGSQYYRDIHQFLWEELDDFHHPCSKTRHDSYLHPPSTKCWLKYFFQL